MLWLKAKRIWALNKLRLQAAELIALGIVVLAIGTVLLATVLALFWSSDLIAAI